MQDVLAAINLMKSVLNGPGWWYNYINDVGDDPLPQSTSWVKGLI